MSGKPTTAIKLISEQFLFVTQHYPNPCQNYWEDRELEVSLSGMIIASAISSKNLQRATSKQSAPKILE